MNLQELMFLVGPNGSGKSNFLDALRFVADALRNSLDHALRDRGTIREVRRRSGGHPNHFALRFDFTLPSGQSGHYSFKIGAKPAGAYEVQSEEYRNYGSEILSQPHHFHIQSGEPVSASFSPVPATLPDRLFLVAVSGIAEFRPVFDSLSRIEVYNLNPREIAAMQKPDPGDILRRDGSNAASVLQRFSPEARALVTSNCDDECPGILGPALLRRAQEVRANVDIFVALACREFETWFVTAARSMRGLFGLPPDLEPPQAAESIRNAKGWLSQRMNGAYDPVIHQLEFSRVFDLERARANRSFDRLYRRVRSLLEDDMG